ncbi:MAG TPA: tetratricopeptide repeat protein [Kofleriaceae bacterium]|nr:tetratricopeptide repeat protein [Kofleriaceae bacterium]
METYDELIEEANLALFFEDYDDAVDLLTRAIDVADDAEPPSVWGNLGYALDKLKLYDAAGEAHRQCVELYEETDGPDHPRTLHKLGNLAFSLIGAGKVDEAEALLRRAVAGFDAQLDREPAWHVQALSNLGYFLLRSRRDPAAALACFARAEALCDAHDVTGRPRDTVRQNRAEAEAAQIAGR